MCLGHKDTKRKVEVFVLLNRQVIFMSTEQTSVPALWKEHYCEFLFAVAAVPNHEPGHIMVQNESNNGEWNIKNNLMIIKRGVAV